MGQYQTRSSKLSEEPEEVGLRKAGESSEPTPVPEPVFGSPIDSELDVTVLSVPCLMLLP